MKRHTQSLRLLPLLLLSALSFPLSTVFAQDSIYTYKGGVVVYKRAVLEVDSLTFTAPAIVPPATPSCGAYIAPAVWKSFMCHNLGANTSLDPIANNEGIYGDLYQWGRPTDGHEKSTSATTSTLASSNTPGHANFIISPTYPGDWRVAGATESRWTDATKALNDPCPMGYKVPSILQWAGVVDNNTLSPLSNGYKFGTELFLPASGYRNYNSGLFIDVGKIGAYWSSTPDGLFARFLNFQIGYSVNVTGLSRIAYGYSVRCIAE